MKISCIIAAGGSSTRFGSDKLEVDLGGKPVLAWSVAAMANHPDISEVVVACSNPEKSKKLVYGHVPSNVKFVMGGDCREESVKKAFEVIGDCNVILVHDAARPFINQEMIDKTIGRAKEAACVIPVIPLIGALKIVKGEFLEKSIGGVYHIAQTPQLVWKKPLEFVFDRYKNRLAEFPDESAMISEYGLTVATVHGSAFNLKITSPEDIKIANCYLSVFKSPRAQKVENRRRLPDR